MEEELEGDMEEEEVIPDHWWRMNKRDDDRISKGFH